MAVKNKSALFILFIFHSFISDIGNIKLSLPRHWQVMMYWFMSSCHNKGISNNVIFALKMSKLSEWHLMTVVINMHKTSFIFMMCHVMILKVLTSS